MAEGRGGGGGAGLIKRGRRKRRKGKMDGGVREIQFGPHFRSGREDEAQLRSAVICPFPTSVD